MQGLHGHEHFSWRGSQLSTYCHSSALTVCCYVDAVQVLCGRCNSLAHGAMIPAVKDFTQKAWLDEQRQLLANKQQQEQQQQAVQAAQAIQSVLQEAEEAAAAAADADREPLELLGKVLITAEELRDQIAVRDTAS